MKQEEKELLEKYLIYRKKRNKIILIIILIFVMLVGGVVSWIYISSSRNNTSKQNVTQIQEETKIKDTEKPVITLKAKQISIFQNDTINYKSYIESVIDNADGNITQNVKYNTIDTSQLGEFQIIYSVQDKAKNEATEQIKVIINKREDTTKEETPSSNTSDKKKNDKPSSNSTGGTSQQKTGGTSSTTKNNEKREPKTKDFLFTDGYDMNTVSKAASDYIDANGGRGEAYPIRDQEGIIIGMRVKIY